MVRCTAAIAVYASTHCPPTVRSQSVLTVGLVVLWRGIHYAATGVGSPTPYWAVCTRFDPTRQQPLVRNVSLCVKSTQSMADLNTSGHLSRKQVERLCEYCGCGFGDPCWKMNHWESADGCCIYHKPSTWSKHGISPLCLYIYPRLSPTTTCYIVCWVSVSESPPNEGMYISDLDIWAGHNLSSKLLPSTLFPSKLLRRKSKVCLLLKRKRGKFAPVEWSGGDSGWFVMEDHADRMCSV